MIEVNQDLQPLVGDNKIDDKIVYSARNMELVKARDLWPKRLDIPEDATVLRGESFVHDGWHPIRTSLVQSIDLETGLVHTRNSVYKLTDGILQGV
uniref:Uncharacterized protein n=1 Tax=Pseudomonas phage RVTF4 TaxID=3236931 RepID=A0AB39CCW8_9VIRU